MCAKYDDFYIEPKMKKHDEMLEISKINEIDILKVHIIKKLFNSREKANSAASSAKYILDDLKDRGKKEILKDVKFFNDLTPSQQEAFFMIIIHYAFTKESATLEDIRIRLKKDKKSYRTTLQKILNIKTNNFSSTDNLNKILERNTRNKATQYSTIGFFGIYAYLMYFLINTLGVIKEYLNDERAYILFQIEESKYDKNIKLNRKKKLLEKKKISKENNDPLSEKFAKFQLLHNEISDFGTSGSISTSLRWRNLQFDQTAKTYAKIFNFLKKITQIEYLQRFDFKIFLKDLKELFNWVIPECELRGFSSSDLILRKQIHDTLEPYFLNPENIPVLVNEFNNFSIQKFEDILSDDNEEFFNKEIKKMSNSIKRKK